MKRNLAAAAGALAAVVIGASGLASQATPAPQSSAPSTVTLSIVGTTDLHGGVLPDGGRGGLALLGGYVNNLRALRARDGGAVLLIDAGDMWQGTLESNLDEGASVVAAYNAAGYVAAAIGNHEFDFGPSGASATPRTPADDPNGALKARAAEAKFPFLAANLIDRSTDRPVNWPNVRPSTTVQAAGIKVGIIGVMTATALTATIAPNVRGLRVAPVADTIADQARRLRVEGAAVVIVAAHAGGSCTRFVDPLDLSSCESPSEIFAVARALPRGLVDVILAGHTHAGVAHEVAGISITSAYSNGRAFGRVDLTIDRRTKVLVTRRLFAPHDLCSRENPRTGACGPGQGRGIGLVASRYEGLAVSPDRRISQVLAPAVERAAQVKATRIGPVLDTPIRLAGSESPLGNLFTDAMRESVAGAQVAINNTAGGLRTDFPSGPLTYGSVYETFPFDNRLVTFTLTGAELKRVLVGNLEKARNPVGISGIRVQARCSGGALVATVLHQSGMPVRDDEKLSVVTTDFLATGGGGILTEVMPPGGFPTADAARLVRDVVADQLRRRGGRLREDDLVDRVRPRWTYPGAMPVTCRQ